MRLMTQTTVDLFKTRFQWGFQIAPVEDEEDDVEELTREAGFYVSDLVSEER